MNTLTQWRDFTLFLHRAFETTMEARRDGQPLAVAQTGVHRMLTNRDELAEYVMAESMLNRDLLDCAVNEFIGTGQWPELSDEATIYLLFRLGLAERAIRLLIAPIGVGPASLFPPPPNIHDEAAFLHWMLIDLWRARGDAILKSWVEVQLDPAPQPQNPGDSLCPA